MDYATSPFTKTRYARSTTSSSPLYHPVMIVLRCILAFILALFLMPLTVPAFVRLPSCLPVRILERLAVHALMLIASIAAVEAVMSPRNQSLHNQAPTFSWLPAPIVRFWSSPLSHGRYVRTFDQPGRWMTDVQLETLRATLEQVATSSIGDIPSHRLFDPLSARSVFSNRVVSVAYDSDGPLGFSAMVYLDVPTDVVVHLGLTMIGKRGRGKRLQSALFTKSLLLPIVNLARVSYNVTNCAASPAGIGNVSEYFFNCFPTFDMSVRRQEHHMLIARHVMRKYRHEFGCSEYATFDENNFVVYKSNAAEGGGTHQFIKEDGCPVSHHRLDECNKFVASLIDFAAGDELFQVATLNLFGTLLKYVSSKRTRRIK